MKKILFVTNDFYPKNIISAVRTTKMVKDIVNHDFDLTIITEELDNETLRDETLRSDELKLMKIEYISHSSLFNKIEKLRNKFLKKNSSTELLFNNNLSMRDEVLKRVMRIAHFIYSIIKSMDWSRQVKKYYKKNLSDYSFDILITTYPRLSSHLFGLWIKKRNHIPTWIADFQDPIYYEVLSLKFLSKYYSYLENEIIKKSNAITVVTNDLLYNLKSYDKTGKKRFIYLPMSYDEADIIGTNYEESFNLDKNKLNITYVGGLYGGKRDMSPIFSAFQKLSIKNHIDLNKVAFNYAGKEYSILYKQAIKYSCEKILNDIGQVNRRVAIELQNESDIIIINTWNTKKDKGVIPGKLYEAFLVKKIILAIVIGEERGSELKEMVESSGLGNTFEFINNIESDYKELLRMESFILDKFTEKQNGIKTTNFNEEFIEEYNYINVTKKLVNLIKEL